MRELAVEEARRIAVTAAHLGADRPGDVVEVADQLAAIKIDPTAVIAPSEQTIPWSRIGYEFEPGQLKDAVERDRLLFEFDGAFRPIDLLPLMLPTMRAWPRRENHRHWMSANSRFRQDVLDRLRAEGPLLARDIPDTAQVARAADGWSGSNQVPTMLDFLSRQGAVAVTARVGRNRVWDLAERVYPAHLLAVELDLAESIRQLDERRLRAAGIAKTKSPWTPVGTAGIAVRVAGHGAMWRVDPAALEYLRHDSGGRVAFLNPYDSMLFDRPRLRDLFDFDYVLEQFKPKHERIYGAFAHPILLGHQFVGMLEARVDCRMSVLHVDAIHEFWPLEPNAHEAIGAEIDQLAEWLGVEFDRD